MFAFLGYASHTIAIRDIAGKHNFTTELSQIDEKLNEVRLDSKYTVFDLIQDALNKVNENYYDNKTIHLNNFFNIKYYSHQSQKYIKEIEAYTKMYRPQINGAILPKIKIEKARKKTFFKYPTAFYSIYNFLLDPIEKDNLFFGINNRNFNKYNYEMKGVRFLNNKPNYYILITDKKSTQKQEAEIYIDTTSLAFSKFTNKEHLSGGYNANASPLYNLFISNLYKNKEVQYEEINGKWYFKDSKFYLKTYEKDTKDTVYVYLSYQRLSIEKENLSDFNSLDCLHENSLIEPNAMLWDDPAWFENKKRKLKPEKK
jgi:hypothetical protein